MYGKLSHQVLLIKYDYQHFLDDMRQTIIRGPLSNAMWKDVARNSNAKICVRVIWRKNSTSCY